MESKPQDLPGLFSDGQGHYVKRISEDQSVVKFAPQGGGFVYRLPRAEFYARFHRAVTPAFSWVQVRGDWFDNDQSVRAAWNQQRWNGWVMPYFLLEEGKALCEAMTDLRYDEATDAFVCRSADADPQDQDADEIYTAELIEVEGQQVKAYPIGAGSWCWVLAT